MLQSPILSRPEVRRAAGLMTIGLAAVIIWASLVSTSQLPPVPGSDKFKHFAAYMALGGPLMIWLGEGRIRLGFALLLVLGAGLEIGQGLGGVGRTASVLDMLANSAGAFTGVLLARLVFYLDRRCVKAA